MTARVLIVDDEPYILRILAFKLRRAGYVALEAASAEEAMVILEGTPVQCVILDVSLPTGTDGFEFAKMLREDPHHVRTQWSSSPPTPSPPSNGAGVSWAPRRTSPSRSPSSRCWRRSSASCQLDAAGGAA